MRKESIDKLFIETAKIIERLIDEREKAGGDKELKELLEVQVKSALEHLRSILDYSANDIFDKLQEIHTNSSSPIKKPKVYFPYTDKEAQFRSRVQGNLPKLETHLKAVYDLIHSMQPFLPDNKWLLDLCQQNNAFKHDGLVPQSRHDFTSVTSPGIRIQKNNNLTMIGNVYNGQALPDVVIRNGISVIPLESYPKEYSFKTGSDFKFKGTNIDIIDLLTTSYDRINEYVAALYPMLGESKRL